MVAYIEKNDFSCDSFERLRQNTEIEKAHVRLPLLFIDTPLLPGPNILYKILLIVFYYCGGGLGQENMGKKIFIKFTELYITGIFMQYWQPESNT